MDKLLIKLLRRRQRNICLSHSGWKVPNGYLLEALSEDKLSNQKDVVEMNGDST